MGAFEEISDRRIRAGREAGLFDDLPGAGKPIKDIDRVRPPGWWAMRVAKTERSKQRAEDLRADVAAAMPALWRQLTAEAADAFVGELNARIDAYNAGTSWDPIDRLDAAELLETWAAVRRRLAD